MKHNREKYKLLKEAPYKNTYSISTSKLLDCLLAIKKINSSSTSTFLFLSIILDILSLRIFVVRVHIFSYIPRATNGLNTSYCYNS